jgi:hypothetical protein
MLPSTSTNAESCSVSAAAISDLWASGARDVFGYRFRDAWNVVGWEEGLVAGQFVCWLPTNPDQQPAAPFSAATPQLELFA